MRKGKILIKRGGVKIVKVTDIVKLYLTENNFDGLCSADGCCCLLENVMYCCSYIECVPGIKTTCDGCRFADCCELRLSGASYCLWPLAEE